MSDTNTPWDRIARAVRNRTGVRLSADDIDYLYTSDHAVQALVDNINYDLGWSGRRRPAPQAKGSET